IRNENEQLVLNDSLVYANRAAGYGGGILSTGTLRVNNSTISNNSSVTDGGGLYTLSGFMAELYFSTVAGNLANDAGSGSGVGGGIYSTSSSVSMRGTL